MHFIDKNKLLVLLCLLLSLSALFGQDQSQYGNFDCDPTFYSEHIGASKATLTAEACFALGQCELYLGNYNSALAYFNTAKEKEYSDSRMLQFYIEESLLAINSGNEILKEGERRISKLQLNNIEATTHSERDNTSVMQVNLLNYLLLSAGLLGLLLGSYLLITYVNNNHAIVYLTIVIAALAEFIMEWEWIWNYDDPSHYKAPFFRVLFYFWVPSFYLYQKFNLTTNSTDNLKSCLKHYSAFALLFIPYMALEVFQLMNHSEIKVFVENVFFDPLVKSLFSLFYLGLLIRLMLRNRNNRGVAERNWLITQVVLFAILAISLVLVSLYIENEDIASIARTFFGILFASIILIYTVVSLMAPELVVRGLGVVDNDEQVLREKAESNEKYRNSGLTPELLKTLSNELIRLMEEEELYLDSELSLSDLANRLNSDRYSVSQVINQLFHKSFYEFLSDYRINKAIALLETHGADIKIIDVAFRSGFSNRVSFNKAFKKRTGQTPSAYSSNLLMVS